MPLGQQRRALDRTARRERLTVEFGPDRVLRHGYLQLLPTPTVLDRPTR